jgi:hypothetical protein
MILNISFTEDLVPKYIEVPIHIYSDHPEESKSKMYQSAISRAIASGIEFEKPEEVKELIIDQKPKNWDLTELEPGKVYSLEYAGRIENIHGKIRLIPESAESQEQIFIDVFQRLYDCLERGHGTIKSILSDFTITRKY